MAIGSFSAGLAGLNANAAYLSVIGNNLANINTIGFKASTVSFMDLVSQTISNSSINPTQVGLGVLIGSISPVFSQGAIENTREATNVAIQGNGFFVVRTPNGNAYTRAGNFSFDKDGYLVSPDGNFVQGYTTKDPVTGAIIVTGQPNDIRIPPGILQPPVATSQFRTVTNLNAASAAATTFTTAVQVFDSLGATHTVTITYTKTGANAWSYTATVPGADVAGGTPGTPFQIGTGTLTFNASGQLLTVNGGAPADVTFTTPAWTNGAAVSTLLWDIMDPNGVASHTGFSSTSATSTITQNGSAAGRVENVTIGPDGTIQGTLGAGQGAVLGQLALGVFNNPKGLSKIGSNLFVQTQSAGVPNIGVAGSGGRGTLIGSALEQSNVDMAQEFTQMILAQRGYQANSKAITVSDEMLVETLNLKR